MLARVQAPAKEPISSQHDWGLHLKSEHVRQLIYASIPMRVASVFPERQP